MTERQRDFFAALILAFCVVGIGLSVFFCYMGHRTLGWLTGGVSFVCFYATMAAWCRANVR